MNDENNNPNFQSKERLNFESSMLTSTSRYLSPVPRYLPCQGEEGRRRNERVGDDYQAVIPDYIPYSQRRPEQLEERSFLCWSPAHGQEEGEVDKYILRAKDQYGYNTEQALTVLFWHKHNMTKVLEDMVNFIPSNWNFEDQLCFDQALQIQGKSFRNIQHMLPEKSIASLVEHYYSRVKTNLHVNRAGKKQRILKEEKSENIWEDELVAGDEDESSCSAIDLKEEEISENVCEDLEEVTDEIRSLCVEETSSSVSDWKLRNDLYEKHCEKNHSDIGRKERTSCPVCLKRVLNAELSEYL